MAEYIERKKLEEAFDNADPDVCESDLDGHSDWGFGRENVRDVIRGVPAADVVPVVRCRDCRYYGCGVCSYLAAAVLPQWFCWNGERDGGADREDD